eukprot:3980046-Pyramimonas_sp.AAC.1
MPYISIFLSGFVGRSCFLVGGSQGQIQEAGRFRLGHRARYLAATAHRPTQQVHVPGTKCPPLRCGRPVSVDAVIRRKQTGR